MGARVSDAIGGSDIAAIRGDSPFKTAMDVYKRIVHGVIEPDAGLAAQLGTACEEVILTDWCTRTGTDRGTVQRSVEVWSEREPHFRGELDGYIPARRVVLDAKLVLSPARSKLWGEPGTDHMPAEYLCQFAWYAMLADAECVVCPAVIFGRASDYIYKRTPAFEAMILDDARRFWRDHVLPKRPPAVQTVDDALWLSPKNTSDVRPATDSDRAVVAAWRTLREQADTLDQQLERAKAAVCAAIGDADGIWLGGNDRVTWKANAKGIRTLRG